MVAPRRRRRTKLPRNADEEMKPPGGKREAEGEDGNENPAKFLAAEAVTAAMAEKAAMEARSAATAAAVAKAAGVQVA